MRGKVGDRIFCRYVLEVCVAHLANARNPGSLLLASPYNFDAMALFASRPKCNGNHHPVNPQILGYIILTAP